MQIIKTKNNLILQVLSVFGILLSLYLTYIKLSNNPTVCNFGDCGKVQSSQYSEIFGIPVATLGIVFYLVAFTLANKGLGKFLKYWLVWGILFSSYLTYLELFVINAICGWCVVSFANIIGMYVIYLLRPRGLPPQEISN